MNDVLTVYTLKNCDTCKKTLKWLETEGIAHTNNDVRTDGLAADTVTKIIRAVGVEKAVNKRSTTWKALDEASRASLDEESAVGLIVNNPTLMKRPAFVVGANAFVGFDAASQAFAKANA